MLHYTKLREHLRDTPYLVADGAEGKIRLTNRAGSLTAMVEAEPFHSQVVMNIGRSLSRFAKITGKADREFNLKQIAEVAGVDYATSYLWMRGGVLRASIRPASGSGRRGSIFSWSDAFSAGICGSLRRQGLGFDTLKKVSPLISRMSKKRARAAR
jgi:hypothetical protein